MAKITKIETQAKNKSRVNIFLDDVFRVACFLDTALKFNFKVGREITEHELEEIIFENEKGQALEKALNLLSKNLKTKKQLKDYLFLKGYSPEIINYVIEKLCEYNYINDVNYGKIYIRSVKHKYGKIKIVNNLKLKGISDLDIEQIVEDFETNDETVFNLAEKYLKNKEININNLSKLYRFLTSKGFPFDTVMKVVNKFKGEN